MAKTDKKSFIENLPLTGGDVPMNAPPEFDFESIYAEPQREGMLEQMTSSISNSPLVEPDINYSMPTPRNSLSSYLRSSPSFDPNTQTADIDYVAPKPYKVVPLDFNNRIKVKSVKGLEGFSKDEVADFYDTKYEHLPAGKKDVGEGSRAHTMFKYALGEVEGRGEKAVKVGSEDFLTLYGVTARDYNPKILGKPFKDLTTDDAIQYLVEKYYPSGLDNVNSDAIAYKIAETNVWGPEYARQTTRDTLRTMGIDVPDKASINDMAPLINDVDNEDFYKNYTTNLFKRVQTWKKYRNGEFTNGWTNRIFFNPMQVGDNPDVAIRNNRRIEPSFAQMQSPSFLLQDNTRVVPKNIPIFAPTRKGEPLSRFIDGGS